MQDVDRPVVDGPVDRIGMAVFAAVGEAEPRRIGDARPVAVNQLADQRQGADRLRSDPRHSEEGFKVFRLPLIGGEKDLVKALRVNVVNRHVVPAGQIERLKLFDLGKNLLGRFPGDPGDGVPACFALLRDQVEDLRLPWAADGGVRLADKILDPLRKPVVAAGIAVHAVHSLLDDCPRSVGGEKKGMVIELIAVLDRVVVDLGAHPAGVDLRAGVEPDRGADLRQLVQGSPVRFIPGLYRNRFI